MDGTAETAPRAPGYGQINTQIMDDPGKTGPDVRELGSKVSDTLREWFVVCRPSEALKLQLELGQPPYMLLHDLGYGRSRTFLASLSLQTGWPLQQLCVRRQGFGDTLATLYFIDCPATPATVRIYASEVEADAPERVAIRRQLAAFAAVNVLYAEHQVAQTAALGVSCLKDDLLAAHRPGGMHLLILPQTRDPSLRQDLAALESSPGLKVEVSPATNSVPSTWALLSTYWNRHAQQGLGQSRPVIRQIRIGDAQVSTRGAATPQLTEAARPSAVSHQPLSIDDYVRLAQTQTGATAVCIFNLTNKALEAQTTGSPGAEMVQQGYALLAAVGRLGDGLSLGRAVRETCVILGDVQVVIRPARIRNGCVLMLMMPRTVEPAEWRKTLDQLDRQAIAQRTSRRS